MSQPADHIKREPDEDKDHDFDYLEACAEDLIHAVHAKDVHGVVDALRAAFQICDSEPHEEGEHV